MSVVEASFDVRSISKFKRGEIDDLLGVGRDEPNVAATMPRPKAEELKENLTQYADLGGDLLELHDTLDTALDARLDNGELSPSIILGSRQVASVALHFELFGPPSTEPDAINLEEAYGIQPLNYS